MTVHRKTACQCHKSPSEFQRRQQQRQLQLQLQRQHDKENEEGGGFRKQTTSTSMSISMSMPSKNTIKLTSLINHWLMIVLGVALLLSISMNILVLPHIIIDTTVAKFT